MSDSSEIASWRFKLDGEEVLGFEYDDEADVLYLWRGDEPSEAIGLTTAEGHVVRLNEETGEIVGFTIFNWLADWANGGDERGSARVVLEFEVPQLEAAQGLLASNHHELELVPA